MIFVKIKKLIYYRRISMNTVREQIVQILFDYEKHLSDGYHNYCGNTKEDIEAKLDEIAEKILIKVKPYLDRVYT